MNQIKKVNSGFLKYQLRTFIYAFRGIRAFFHYETKSVIHLIAAIAAVTLGILLSINPVEWLLIALAIGLVFITELFNTAIEKLTDLVEPEKNPLAGDIKDISAGAVLVGAITALLIGLIIYVPEILSLFN